MNTELDEKRAWRYPGDLAELGNERRLVVVASPSQAHRIYNAVDDEAPTLATLFASRGAPPPDGTDVERGRAFELLLEGRRIRDDLGFKPKYPRLADAIAAGA